MSTPLEVVDPWTRDNIFVDEHGLIAVLIPTKDGYAKCDLTVEGALELQEVLAKQIKNAYVKSEQDRLENDE